MRTLQFYLYCAWQMFIKSIFNLHKLRRYQKEKKFELIDKFFVNVYKYNTTAILRLSGVDISVEGIENIPITGPVVFISNHQGNFDVISIVSYIPRKVSFIAKKELGEIPLLGMWMKVMGCLFIDRSDIRQSAQVITNAIEYIKSGNAMLIFPEGTRSKDGNLGEFKAGSFKIAVKSGAPIIPISINGSRSIMEDNNGKVKPGKISLTYHKPISTKELSKEEINELPEKIKEIIEAGLKK